jgi:hypothetical protein
MELKTIKHLNPIWGDRADFIIRANLTQAGPLNLPRWEQLWCRKIAENHFEICCIPFFVYNISLGDEVITDAENWIIQVWKESGHYTFRVWFGDALDENIQEEVMKTVENSQCLFEWYSRNLLGIDTPDIRLAEQISGYLQEKEIAGWLKYETGRL